MSLIMFPATSSVGNIAFQTIVAKTKAVYPSAPLWGYSDIQLQGTPKKIWVYFFKH